MLTKEDKIQIINAHSKSLNYSKYNLQIDIVNYITYFYKKNIMIIVFS